jgi:hypothetical protein
MKHLKRLDYLPMLFFFSAPFWTGLQLPAWMNWILTGFAMLMLVYALWRLEKKTKSEGRQ